MKKTIMTTSVAAIALTILGASVLQADPINETLEIDGKEMITRAKAPDGHPFDEVLSGWLFREPTTRALEVDPFENPGMLAVEEGATIWNTVEGTAGKSCASCHGDAAESMKAAAAKFPKWDAASKRPVNIEMQINSCREKNMGAAPYEFDKGGQVPLTTYIRHQAIGTPMSVDLSQGEMQKWFDMGKEVYYTRTGQLNLSCANCHEALMGKMIRADHLSQGQINGFPTYRLKSGLTSLHNRFRGCISDTRGTPPKAFSDELMALEVYVTWRGTGLSIETPSVRQ